ncbi:MAG: Stp1/IreP family PP2C-type Ser/Thr phosphatase [Myxococcales bacterium]|nr:Stp1/IreP family PP2C-type Ser/Thr phosphatase [Myxococcales bacterium]MCB9576698.1 Stp1/IreP family PP2C-type Ser/Thr phosphatase [Polyangiaceae bacterium]
MRAVAAGISDVGLQRDHNEDSFAILNDQELYVVADGMGGHRAGDVASRLATDAMVEFFRATAADDVTWPFHFDARLSEEENRLLTGIRIANRQIIERSLRSRECHGMGTTIVGALFSPSKKKMFIGHVGDSRAYRVRKGKIAQLTRDHSLVNDYLLAMPELTEEQRSELPKNVITRALGMQDHVTVDLQSDEAEEGDLYVLCSDGLSGMIGDEEILEISRATDDLHEACRLLVALANEHGGEDNITAVVVRIEEGPSVTTLASTELPDAKTEPAEVFAEASTEPGTKKEAEDDAPPPSAPSPEE